MTTKKRLCPSCGEVTGLPLIYGAPDKITWEAYQRGEVILAGCLVEANEGSGLADRQCSKCGHLWKYARPT